MRDNKTFWKTVISLFIKRPLKEEEIDKEDQFEALLIDFLKAFDCIDHKILIVKLYGYGVSLSALNILSSYLKDRTAN